MQSALAPEPASTGGPTLARAPERRILGTGHETELFSKVRFVYPTPSPHVDATPAGITHDVNGKMWLQVNEIQQAGTEGFKDVRGQEKWMPDNGGSWNGGQWLHEPKE